MAKLVPFSLGMTLDTALKQSKELREKVESDPQVGELFHMARKVEGMPRHASTHAGRGGHHRPAGDGLRAPFQKRRRGGHPSTP